MDRNEVHVGGDAGCAKPPRVESLHVAGAAEIALPAYDLRCIWFHCCGTQLTALCSRGAFDDIYIFNIIPVIETGGIAALTAEVVRIAAQALII